LLKAQTLFQHVTLISSHNPERGKGLTQSHTQI
jgi:hypothetical protein